MKNDKIINVLSGAMQTALVDEVPDVADVQALAQTAVQLWRKKDSRNQVKQVEDKIEDNTRKILQQQAITFIENAAPYHLVGLNDKEIKALMCDDASKIIDGMTFFRFKSCTIAETEKVYDALCEKMSKLLTAVYALDVPIMYGLIGYQGQTNLVFGIEYKWAQEAVEKIIGGLLTDIDIEPYKTDFASREDCAKFGGVISAVPILKIEDEKQKFDLSTLMRSLNGRDYTVLCIAKPYSLSQIQEKYNNLIDVHDKCFSISKKNIANLSGGSQGTTITKTNSFSSTSGWSLILLSASDTISNSVSKAKTESTNWSTTESYDIQNGLALELIKYSEKAEKRMRQGQNSGMWGVSVAYSATDELTCKIIQACLRGELEKPSDDIVPLGHITYELDADAKEQIRIPRLDYDNRLFAPITSEELGMLCTPPCNAVPDFELRHGKSYPMVASNIDGVEVGYVTDGSKSLKNMKFVFGEANLNKHTFVCGITGSGKTTTVKRILTECQRPFMVIEPAKKEYRNLVQDKIVYTLGYPELNCLQFNPFYIQHGINVQTHIDFLKDLFNASFSFYGPMPYILEKCLQNIYAKKGWNMSLGYHPLLLNLKNSNDAFDAKKMKEHYSLKVHKYLFPTMQELKKEVKRYIDTEMQYDGEIGGNIKTAMLARLDSLCGGKKGFMLDTHTPVDMEELMNKNVIFELEGLADDSDKAFCVGLFVIFINEYRQIHKEEHPEEHGLQHLLVIEEAHRLLKNVETERTSENMGNPKGKAVEHFTNMIAEMRSYGQGVIIAEQIPSKLAPDVIKNSSNKIVHRLVAADDQKLIANTIGIKEDDAVDLGNLKTGFALCHKEGMGLPVCVKVSVGEEKRVSNEELYVSNSKRMFDEVNINNIMEKLNGLDEMLGLKLLNSILAQESNLVSETINFCRQKIEEVIADNDIRLLFAKEEDKNRLFGKILTDAVMEFFINGAYNGEQLLSNELYDQLLNIITGDGSITEILQNVRNEMDCVLYKQSTRRKCITCIAERIKSEYIEGCDLKKSIEGYFVFDDSQLVNEIEQFIKGGL